MWKPKKHGTSCNQKRHGRCARASISSQRIDLALDTLQDRLQLGREMNNGSVVRALVELPLQLLSEREQRLRLAVHRVHALQHLLLGQGLEAEDRLHELDIRGDEPARPGQDLPLQHVRAVRVGAVLATVEGERVAEAIIREQIWPPLLIETACKVDNVHCGKEQESGYDVV